jgi:hypothetical protein
MLTKKLGIFCAAAMALATALVPASAHAGEPLNNNRPWPQSPNDPSGFRGDASIFTTVNIQHGWGTAEPLTAGDQDYLVMSCGGYAGGLGNVQFVRVDFTHSQGDIDIQVFKTDGTYIGQSISSSNKELLDVSAQKAGAVVMRVYGYNGVANAGGYKVSLWCK